jgi:hypothetical protein
MATVRGLATRWLSDDFPGFVEVVLTDASQVGHTIHEKALVLSVDESLSPASAYPREIWIDAEVLSQHQQTVTVRLAHSVESLDGLTDFGKTVKIGEMFVLGNGQQIPRPPGHPRCRCGRILNY